MQVVQDVLVGFLVMATGALVSMVTLSSQQAGGIEEKVLGPLGALAFAIVVIGYLLRYLSAERKEARENNNRYLDELKRQLAEKDKIIEARDRQIELLMGRRN